MPHITESEIQYYIDKKVTQAGAKVIEDHLARCSSCSGKVKSHTLLNRSLKRIPQERVSPDFTTNIMRSLGIKDVPSFAWTLLSNTAPLLMSVIVLGIIIGALNVAGVWSNQQNSKSVEAAHSIYQAFKSGTQSVSDCVYSWFINNVPFAVTNDSVTLFIFLVFFFSAIALMDKYLFVRLIKKR